MEAYNYESSRTSLIDIQEIPDPYRKIFSGYPCFNKVQSSVFHDVLYTDQSIAVSAPTGSGKTAIFELAVVRQLIAIENSKYSSIFKIVYISPMKALCEERLIDWHKKFSSYGVHCISITGDSDYIDFHSLSNHNLIITTPEKWDSITRKWRDNKSFIQAVKLFMIDEIHLLNEENRGATLEALVCRMKTIQSTIFDEHDEGGIYLKQNIRFLAASATFPNIKDVGEWLCDAKYFSFEDNIRPVKLNTIVLGYSYNLSSTPFKFDITLNYKLPGLILKYSNGKPTLIFCSTRKSVEMAVKHLTMTLTVPLDESQKETLRKASSSITDSKLKSSLLHGIGYHHGGLLHEARTVIEQLFRAGILPVLITTSTLATGVNLPAHLVIIKSTKFYDKGGFQDYTAIAILQMLGRAGRPQFDIEATALILTSTADKEKFENMTDGKKAIESNLHRHLTEHLNAEIVLGTITGLDVAMRWLSSTFLYIRARQNPRHYSIPIGLTSEKIDKKLLEVCQIDLNKLVKAEMATMDEDINIKSTSFGELMAQYYMSFETMKLFKTLTGNEILQQILSSISKCKEFSDMRLRVDEKKCLNLLNKNKNKNSIRFPFSGKIKTIDMKINCTIQAIFGCLEIEDHSILSEAFRIMRLGERICRCLIEYWKGRTKCYSALLNTILLWKCFRAQLWENSPHIAKQFPGIGLITSNQLVNAQKTSFDKIIKTNPREIEMITKKKPPFGNKVIEIAMTIPKYDMTLEKINQGGKCTLKVVLSLLNPECLRETPVVGANDIMSLLIGDNHNNILLYERYMHSHMLENNRVVKLISINQEVDEINSHFISENIVGIDLNDSISLKYRQEITKQYQNNQRQEKEVKSNKPKKKNTFNKLDEKYANFVQTYIDSYLKCKKNNSKITDREFLKPKQIEPVLNDSTKHLVSKNYPKHSSDSDTPEEVDAAKKSDQKIDINIDEVNPAQRSDPESGNSTSAAKDYYNLASFDGKDEVPKNILENDENILNRTSVTPRSVESLTDAEIAEHMEGILDENQKYQNDLQVENERITENFEEHYQTENKQQDREFLNFQDFDEFGHLYNKYEINQQNLKVEDPSENFNTINSSCGQNVIESHKTSQKKKEKLHSAESFENAIFNPNAESLNAYRYKPNKRFSHNNYEFGHLSVPQSKRHKSETHNNKMTNDMMKNLDKYIEPSEKHYQYAKSIKWRSPLVYSPPVKYSPKISTSFSFSIPMPKKSDFESSHDWSMTTQDTNSSSKNLRASSSTATPRYKNITNEGNTRIQGSKFLLADKEYQNDEINQLSERNSTLNQTQNTCCTPRKSLQLQDIISSSFLEDVGLSKSPRVAQNIQSFIQQPKLKNEAEMTVGTYYRDLIAKNTRIPPNTLHTPQVLQGKTPFFLNQNTMETENDSRCGVPYRKPEVIPAMNNLNFNQSYHQSGTLSDSRKLYEFPQFSGTFPSTHNVIQPHSDNFCASSSHRYLELPQNFAHNGQENRKIIDITSFPPDFTGYPPSHSNDFAQGEHFSGTHIQNSDQMGINVRSDCQGSFHEFDYVNGKENVMQYLPPNSSHGNYTKSSQGHVNYHQHRRLPLYILDQNVDVTQNREIPRAFINPNNFGFKNGAMNYQNHELGNPKQSIFDSNESEYSKKNSQYSEYEHRNYLPNIARENPQNSFGVQEPDGYYLNKYPSSTLRYDGDTNLTWNAACTNHRVFNCPICKIQTYPSSLNTEENSSNTFPHKGMYPIGCNSANNSGVPVRSPYQDFEGIHEIKNKPGDSSGYQYANTTNCHRLTGFNEAYGHQMDEQDKFSKRLHSNTHSVNNNTHEDPFFFQNSNFTVSQRNSYNGVNSETSCPRERKRVIDYPNQQGVDDQGSNKKYLLNKFLHSYEESQMKNKN